MAFPYVSYQCWHHTTLSCTWTRWIQHLYNARERDHTWSITSHQPCSGKRKTVPKRKASAFQKCERRPQEFCGVVKDKRGASSAVCSQCKIISLQVCNKFSPEMCSTKLNPSCFPSRLSYVTAISRFQSCSVISPNSVTLEFDDNSIAIYTLKSSVTPTFLSRNALYLQLSLHCPKMNK